MGVITNYVAPAKTNPYKADIDALINAGEGAAYELAGETVAAEGKRGSIATERVKFQTAARDAGYTAKVVESEEREDGTTRLVFVLTDKRSRTAKPKGDDAEAKPKGK